MDSHRHPRRDPCGRPTREGGAVKSAPSKSAPAKSPATADTATAEARPTGAPAPKTSATTASGSARYGEAVVREILGANFLEEHSLAPRDKPTTLGPDATPDLSPDAGLGRSPDLPPGA